MRKGGRRFICASRAQPDSILRAQKSIKVKLQRERERARARAQAESVTESSKTSAVQRSATEEGPPVTRTCEALELLPFLIAVCSDHPSRADSVVAAESRAHELRRESRLVWLRSKGGKRGLVGGPADYGWSQASRSLRRRREGVEGYQ
eukprot:772156-Rhodomonas_salina.3